MKTQKSIKITVKVAILLALAVAVVMPGMAAVSTFFEEQNNSNNGNEIEAIIPDMSPTGVTIYVDDDNTVGPWDGTQSNPYQYIADGVNASSNGDTVFVYAGDYHERFTISTSITLIGEDKETTIIDGDNAGNIIILNAGGIVIEALTIKDAGTDSAKNGVYLINSGRDSCIVRNCIVTGCYYGIQLVHSEYHIVENNTIINTTLGLLLIYHGNSIVRDNIIINNTIGLAIPNSYNMTIYHNYFKDNDNHLHNYIPETTKFDNGYPSGGNRWDEYDEPAEGAIDEYSGPNQDITGSDGIADTPYSLPASAQDTYPLMAPWTLVDYIEITDVPDGTPILDQTVEDSCLFLTGYASSYSNTLGYLGLVNVTWSVENTGSDALTNPTYGTSSMFISGTTSGTAVWSIEDGHGHTDSIEFIIVEYVPPTVDYIIIADSSNGNPILDQSVENSCLMLTGYASAYNNSEGYLSDVDVDWSVANIDSDATTNPGFGSSSMFISGTTAGTAIWTADDGSGHTYDVEFIIEDDSQNPVTTVSFTGTIGDNNWYTTSVDVALSATDDNSGVDYTMYKVDGGIYQTYTAPFTIDTEGQHTIYYYSVDIAGNVESEKTDNVDVDMTDPSISNPQYFVSDPMDTETGFGWENITCEATDNMGIDTVTIKITDPNNTIIENQMNKVQSTNEYYYYNTFAYDGIYNYTITLKDEAGHSEVYRSNFTIFNNWDINMDYLCDIYDLVQVSLLYGEIGSAGWIRTDVDNNGEVDVFDLVKVSFHYNENTLGAEYNIPTPRASESSSSDFAGEQAQNNPPSAPLATSIISISPSTQTVGPNEVFTVDVYVEPGEEINAVSFDSLTFDETLLQANSVTEGDLFNPYDTFFGGGTIDNVAGEITNVYGLTMPATNTVSDPGVFCTIEFTSLTSTGVSSLDLFTVKVSDINGDPVDVNTNNGNAQVDAQSPQITDNSPSTGTTGDSYTFTATITDNMDPATSLSVSASWSHDSLGDTTTLSHAGGNTFEATITLDQSVSDMSFTITADDSSGNSQTTSTTYVTVTDNDAPTITGITGNTGGTTGETTTITASFSDNIGVTTAMLYYKSAGAPGYSSKSIISGSAGIYIPSGNDEDWYYYVIVDDAAGNGPVGDPSNDGSSYYIISVVDNDVPSINSITGNTVGTTGETTTISVSFSDNIGVTTATLYYKYATQGGWSQKSILSGSAGIDIPQSTMDYYYYVTVDDAAGNGPVGDPSVDGSVYYVVSVNDNDAPQLSNDQTSSFGTTGETITFQVDASDNIGVAHVYVNWRKVGGPSYTTQEMTGAGTYSRTINIDLNDDTDIQYYFEAVDSVPLSDYMYSSGSPELVTIFDNDIPSITAITGNTNGIPGSTVTITASFSDNIGVTVATLHYKAISAGPWSTTSILSGSAGIDIPLAADEDYIYYVTVDDAIGNGPVGDPSVDGSIYYVITVADTIPPTITYVTGNTAGTTGETTTISSTFTDNIGVTVATLHYKTASAGSWSQTSILSGTAGINIPSDSAEDWYYFITVDDDAGNGPIGDPSTDGSTYYTISVTDNDYPSISNDQSDNTGTTGESVTFRVDASDNIDVAHVYVYWRKVGASTYTKQEMTGGPTYSRTISVDQYDDANIQYYLEVEDDVPLKDTMYSPSTPATIMITDNDQPALSAILYTHSDPMDTEPAFGFTTIDCTATDNINVDEVHLSITYPDTTVFDYSMTNIPSTDDYYYTTTYSDIGEYSYFVWADDPEGNTITSGIDTFTIYPNWDLDLDNDCDIFDLVKVSLQYGIGGQPNGWIREDVNNDGDIDIFDMVQVSLHYNENYLTLDFGDGNDYMADTIVSISPSHQNVGVGETFTVDVYVEPGEPINAVSFDLLSFDQTIVQANSVVEGNLFAGAPDTFFSAGTIDNVAGEITDVWGLTMPATYTVVDPGVFCTIEFIAQSEIGTSNLDLTEVKVSDANGEPAPVIVNQGSVNVDFVPPTIDSIVITQSPNGAEITNQLIGPSFSQTGYASSYNDSSGYIGLVSVSWSVSNSGSNAYTTPSSGTSSTFNEGTQSGTATWTANDGSGHTDSVVFTIDLTPPETTCVLSGSTGDNSYYITPVEVSLSATDSNGIDRIEYQLDVGSWQIYTTPITVNNDGDHSIRFYAVDTIGNTETQETVNFQIDQRDPVISNIVTNPETQDQGEIVTVSCSVTDNIALTEVKISMDGPTGFTPLNVTMTDNGGNDFEYDDSYDLIGTYSYQIWALDYAGNGIISPTYYFGIIEPELTVDYLTITSSPDGTPIVDQTVGADFTINGYASSYNNSAGYIGLASSIWSVDNTDSNANTNPLSGLFSTFDGGLQSGTAVWAADDGLGHTNTVTFTIDVDAPTTTCQLTGTIGLDSWYTTPVQVQLIASDPSGITTTRYRLDSGSEQTYTSPFMVSSNGDHTVYYYSIDTMGNSEIEKSTSFKIDQNHPEITDIQAMPPSQDQGGPVNITATATDNEALLDVKCAITGPQGFPPVNTSMNQIPAADSYYYEQIYSIVGSYSFSIYAQDSAGNTKTVSGGAFTIQEPLAVDYIRITDAPDGSEIADQAIEVNTSITGYASAYNNTVGFLDIVTVSWSVENVGTTAFTNPTTGNISTFNSSSKNGTAIWIVDDGKGHTDSVEFTIELEQIGPDIQLVMPEKGNLYFCNMLLYRGGFNVTTVLGFVTITVDVTDPLGVDRVEFSLDDGSFYVDNQTNISRYIWDLYSWRIGEYVLNITAYNAKGIPTTEMVDLRIVCFGFFDNSSNSTIPPNLTTNNNLRKSTVRPVVGLNPETDEPSSPDVDTPIQNAKDRIEQIKQKRVHNVASIIETLRKARENKITGFQLLQKLRENITAHKIQL